MKRILLFALCLLPFAFAPRAQGQPAPFNYPSIGGAGGGTDYVTNSSGLATNLSVYSSGTTNQPLRVFAGTQTNSNPVEISAVWNAAGVDFTALKLNVTNTASATGSKLADFQAGGTSKVTIDKDGIILAGSGTFPTLAGIGFKSSPSAGLYEAGGAVVLASATSQPIGFDIGTTQYGYFTSTFFSLSASHVFGWGASLSSPDTGIARNSAGVIEANNGTAGTYRDVKLRTLLMSAQPSDPSSSATAGQIYSKTNAGTTEVFVIDGAGNVTQISPHARGSSPAPAELDASDKTPIVIHHKNVFTGEQEWLHLSALAREVEKLSGKQFVFKSAIPAEDVRNWDAEEAKAVSEIRARRLEELQKVAEWTANTNANKGLRPVARPIYVPAPKPVFLR